MSSWSDGFTTIVCDNVSAALFVAAAKTTPPAAIVYLKLRTASSAGVTANAGVIVKVESDPDKLVAPLIVYMVESPAIVNVSFAEGLTFSPSTARDVPD